MASNSQTSSEVFRPSRLIRWPLYLTNGFLGLSILAILAFAAFFFHIKAPPPFALIACGLLICTVFFLINTAVLSLRLSIDTQNVTLSIWPWRRKLNLNGCIVQKVTGPLGVTAVRIISKNKQRIWISAGWFQHFDKLHTELERRAQKNNGNVFLVLH